MARRRRVERAVSGPLMAVTGSALTRKMMSAGRATANRWSRSTLLIQGSGVPACPPLISPGGSQSLLSKRALCPRLRLT